MDHGVKAVIGDVPLHQYASRINRWMASAQCGDLTALGTGEFETSNPWTTAVRCVTHWLNLGYCCLSASQMRLGTKVRELSKFRKHRSNSPTTNVVKQVPRHKTGAGALPLILRLGGQVHLRAVATLSVDRARSTIWSWSGGWVNKFLKWSSYPSMNIYEQPWEFGGFSQIFRCQSYNLAHIPSDRSQAHSAWAERFCREVPRTRRSSFTAACVGIQREMNHQTYPMRRQFR